MDCHPPGSSVRGILQARTLEWWPFPPPGGLPDPGIKPMPPLSSALAGGFFTSEPPGVAQAETNGISHSVMSDSVQPHGF